MSLDLRVGIGYDSHRLVDGRRLILGGVEIPFEKGLSGHSDGDILFHALTDALLGAVAAGDIGHWFHPLTRNGRTPIAQYSLSAHGDCSKTTDTASSMWIP